MNQRGLLWIGAIGAIASLTIVFVVIAGGAATARAEPCWDPGYTGGFSWLDGKQHNYGWHTAHAASTPCTAELHSAGCNCGWCGAQHGDAATGCPCPWCTAGVAGAETADGWYAHGADCGCNWCSSLRSGGTAAVGPGTHAHSAGCGCGWCRGHGSVAVTEGAPAGHGHGCCCGWCSGHAEPASDTPAAPAGGHCGCC